MSNSCLNTAARFAAALDAEDYDTLVALLTADCEYVARDGACIGPEAIARSYRTAGTWAKSHIEAVTYESSVREAPDGAAIVTFIDHLVHAGIRHTYSCEQQVHCGADGRICRIVHCELPGQREAADAFLRQIGVVRTPPGLHDHDE